MRRFANKILHVTYFLLMPGQFGVSVILRRHILRRLLRQDLRGVLVRANVLISEYRKLSIGNHVAINHNCVLSCEGGLEIGDRVAIGAGTTILTTEHSYEDPDVPIRDQPLKYLPVKIGANTWIGARVVILGGVTIAEGTVVAAGAVVTKNITDPNTVVGGVPARLIKGRFAAAERGR
jgi:acetyltransferase-like isoleucine patch superfamily enzyme